MFQLNSPSSIKVFLGTISTAISLVDRKVTNMFVWVEGQPTGFEKKADRRLKESFKGGATSKKLGVQPDFKQVDFSESFV